MKNEKWKIFIVIPAYNESKIIAETVQKVKKYYQDVIVVDDGSKDNTTAKAEGAGAEVLRHIINRGQGAALRTGMRYATEAGADIIVTFDADGQFDAADIEKMCAPIISGKYDVVLGTRFNGQNKIPFLKNIFLKLSAVLFTRMATGFNLSDIQNGFRTLSARAAQKITIRQDRMAHAFEIIHETARSRLRCKEVPVTVHYTEYSKNKGQKISGLWKILFDLIFK